MDMAFVPLRLLATFVANGWKLVPNYEPPHRGWAVLMWRQLN